MKNERYIENKPLFFLFTCVKNGRQYINKLFDSLLNQVKINFVHYIYDDGSEDPVDDLVYEYSKKAANLNHPYDVVYEKNPINIGLNMSTKHCIDMCDCPYFIWIDCDNWIDSHFFEEMEKVVTKHKDAILVRSRLLNQDGKNAAKYSKNFEREKEKKQLKNFFYNMFSHGFFCVNRSYYLDINRDNYFFTEKGFYNDEQVNLTCMLSEKNFYFCEKAIGYFLERKDSESAVNAHQSIDYYFNLFEMLVARYDTNFSNKIKHIKYLRTSFNEMDSLKKIDPKKAMSIYFDRLKIIKKYNINREFRYRRKNGFYWLIALLYCRIRYGNKKV